MPVLRERGSRQSLNSPTSSLDISISVIIPTYNMGWCVERAIQSVLEQDVDDLQVIVVDDGSTDDTVHRLNQFGRRIAPVHQANRGLSAARNAGIKSASGEFLAFLDADDRFRPHKLAIQRAYLIEHPECAAVFSNGYLVSPVGQVLNLISSESPRGIFAAQTPADLRRALFRGHPFPSHSAMVRKTCALAVGLFDESMRAREDLDFWLRLSESFPIAYLPGVLVDYTVRTDSLSRSSEVMYSTTTLFDRIYVLPDFRALPARERAKNLRAWAVEAGIVHYGPWSKRDSRPMYYAREARRLDPWNWKSLLLPYLLASPWLNGLVRLAMRYQTALSRRKFARNFKYLRVDDFRND
jgi:glycosyltransferase involved in cell wall biosynthesis